MMGGLFASWPGIALVVWFVALGWLLGYYRGLLAWAGGLGVVLTVAAILAASILWHIWYFSPATLGDLYIDTLLSFGIPSVIGAFSMELREGRSRNGVAP